MRKENIVYSLNIFNGIIFWNSLSQNPTTFFALSLEPWSYNRSPDNATDNSNRDSRSTRLFPEMLLQTE